MHVSKEKPVLRLVKSAAIPVAGRVETALLAPRANAYYQRIEAYARKIRRSEDINVIIRILDEALRETGELLGDHSARLAREEVMRAEHQIVELKLEMEQLRGLIHVDHLTGAMNRSGLDQAFRRETAHADRHGTPLGIALIDIDNFKALNDVHGHQAGDDALVYLVTMIKETLRPDDMVARYGGEEFLILLPNTELDEAVAVIERLQRNLTKRIFLQNSKRTQITFSAGVTQRMPGEAQETAVARADKTLYRAKHTGKNQVLAAPMH